MALFSVPSERAFWGQSDDSQARRANLWVDKDGGRDAPEPLLRGRAHRRGLRMGGVSPPEAVVRA
jgi:hypothetical protein